MAESEQEKSEQATPFKLVKARQKGNIARGMDLSFFTALAAFSAYLWMAGPGLGETITRAVYTSLAEGVALSDGRYAVLAVVYRLFAAVMPAIVLLIAAVVAVVFLFEVIQTGVVFSTGALKPDFERLNPVNGLKRIFTARMLLETGKNVLKLSLYTAAAYFVVSDVLHNGMGSVQDAGGLLAAIFNAALRLLFAFAGIAALFAVLDQLIARRDFLKRMRMSRHEIKQEVREREGEPRIKQRRKQLHAEFAKMNQSVRNLRGADVLITNPQHIALALRYDRATMPAPVIVSIGTNHMAQRLKRLAFIRSIPIIENRPLARALLRGAALNKPIPESCYRPVADIYRTIRRNTAPAEAKNV